MTSARSFLAKWFVTSLVPLAVASIPQVFAQGGFGPDPYRPFNQQYDAFVYPVAPGQGDVVPNEGAMNRFGTSRSNQFQDYMRSLGENGGTYRSQRRLDPKDFREQQYQPNRKVDEQSGFYEKQDVVSQAYFAYIRERDPKKRAELLKEYQKERSKPAKSFAPSAKRRSAKIEDGLGADGSSAASGRTARPAPARPRALAVPYSAPAERCGAPR